MVDKRILIGLAALFIIAYIFKEMNQGNKEYRYYIDEILNNDKYKVKGRFD